MLRGDVVESVGPRSARCTVVAIAALVSTTLIGCGTQEVVPPPPAGAVSKDLDRLPPCDPPEAPDEPLRQDVLLPPGAYLTVVETEGPLTTANGWAPLSPVDLRAFYEVPLDGWELVTAEDEVVEAEVLLRSAAHRFFVMARAACPEGSSLYVRIIDGADP